MILVRNLRQRLNGNSLAFLLIFVLAGFSSCDAFKKAQDSDRDKTSEEKDELEEIQGDRVYNPKTGKYEYSTNISQTLDTVDWKVTLIEDNPPITSEATEEAGGVSVDGNPDGTPSVPDDGKSQKLDRYNVSFLLPFYSQRFGDGTSISRNSLTAINYYGGAKIAFDELYREGIRLDVKTHDTKGSSQVVNQLMNSNDLANSHLVFGPFIKDNIITAAKLAKDLRKPLVSPISPSSNVTSDNPYFIQVSPYLQTHCEAITQHALKNYRPEQIVLVVRNKKAEISRLQYFQAEYAKINGTEDGARLKEFIITDQTADLSEMDLNPYIQEKDTTVFIVPSWSNESFVYSLMRNIQVVKGKKPVVIYGMPQWMKYERISYDYYEQLNLHVSSSTFIDNETTEIKEFRQKYYDRYHTIPTEEAYIGYDVTLFFGRMLAKHGTRFQDHLDAELADYLHTKFRFVREVPLSAALDEDFTKTNLFENKYVNILKFRNYHFQPAN